MIFDIQNSFNHEITVIVTSVSLYTNGSFFVDSICNIPAGQSKSASFNIDNYIVKTVLDTNNRSAIALKFTPVIYKNPADDFIRQGDRLSINFGVDKVDDFDATFGFFGYLSKDIDTVLDDLTTDMLNGLEGEFNVTNPIIKLDYRNSIGVATDISVKLDLSYNSKPDVTIDLGTNKIGYSTDYLNPEYLGSILFDRTTVPNIDELIAFPLPITVNSVMHSMTNVGSDSATTFNFGLRESEIIVGADIEVPLEFRADLTYCDTIQIRTEEPDNNTNFEVDFVDFYYTFSNYFPIGFGGYLVLYDSISKVTLDTIKLSTNSDFLIEPAPVDFNGEVIDASVREYKDKIAIDASTAENLLNIATHLIFKAKLQTTDFGTVNSVRIGASNSLKFQFGIDAKGTYTSN
jgi:hypothetical protein